ncbi:MAG TPA: 4Fe-4S dicluster domain-containing protein [Bacteroidetes bacterium]|nr:4Fe-4S dicluster domain-containing protein [Bacteroidota bacterium]
MFNAYLTNSLRFSRELCIDCLMCSTVCPHAVFERNNGVVQMIRPQNCMECGACQLNCPTNAITVESGVGCATAMMLSSLRGKKEVSCGCSGDPTSCC